MTAGPDKEALKTRLLAIVSERTGYPQDMLGLDLDLEADLGVDSIKRVEILGTFQQRLPRRPERRAARLEEVRVAVQVVEQLVG